MGGNDFEQAFKGDHSLHLILLVHHGNRLQGVFSEKPGDLFLFGFEADRNHSGIHYLGDPGLAMGHEELPQTRCP